MRKHHMALCAAALCGLLTACGGAGAPMFPEAREAKPLDAEPSAEPRARVEARPVQLGTPPESRAAAPEWWLSETVFGFGKQPGYAPEIPNWNWFDLKRMFAAADVTGPHAELSRQTLVCRVRVDYRESRVIQKFVKADLVVAATFGEQHSVVAHGEDDTGEAIFLLPLVALKRGEALSLGLADRNLFSFVKIGKESFKYQGGLPWTFSGKTMRGDCRGVSRRAVEDLLLKLKRNVDKTQSKQDKCLPSATSPHFGHNCIAKSSVRRDLLALAALVGWGDPRVKKRVARDLGTYDKFKAALPPILEAAWNDSAGKETIEVGGIRLSDVKPTCGLDAIAGLEIMHTNQPKERGAVCELMVTVRNDSKAPVEMWSRSIGDMRAATVFDTTGDASEVIWLGEDANGERRKFDREFRTLEPGDERRLVGWYHAGPAPPKLMLRIAPLREATSLMRISVP